MSIEFISLIILVDALLCGWLGGWLGSHRGRTGLGFVLGFLLGPIGCIIAALLPPGKNKTTSSSYTGGTGAVVDYQRWQQQQAAARAAAAPPVIPLQIRRGTEILGVWTVPEIKNYLAARNLVPEDEYYDATDQEWFPLASAPWI